MKLKEAISLKGTFILNSLVKRSILYLEIFDHKTLSMNLSEALIYDIYPF